MRTLVFVFVYAFIIIFANTSFAEVNELKKFIFNKDHKYINNLQVLDINGNQVDILKKGNNLCLKNEKS